MPAFTFDEILKFNPYHDSKGRFSNADGATSFTYSPGKSKAHDLAIQREKERDSASASAAGSGGSADVHSAKPGKINYESEDFGKPGTYIVYRNGAIGKNGMLFFAPKKEAADSYASSHGNGNTTEYEVQVKNPLVIRGVSDAQCVSQAYNILNPDKPMKGPMTSAKWIKADKANAAKIGEGKEYDAILYEVDGKPQELQIPAKSAASLKQTAEYTTTAWSRLGWTMEEAKAKGLYDKDPQDYQKVSVNKSAQEDDSFTIQKADEDKRLVFGWASIAITVDGEQLEDRQKDIIDPEDLEEAAYEYVLNFRDTGEEHIPSMRKKGKLVESCVLTAEKQKAMGIPEGTLPIGWWIGFKIEDDAAWERVKNGTYKMFSIEGKASRIPVEKSERVAKTFDEILKANPYHDSLGRFASAPGGGSATPKMSAATAIGEYQNYAYQAVNDGLRSGKLEGKAKEISDALDDAISNAKPTKWAQTVHRADGAATTAEIWEKTDLSAKLPQSGSMMDVWADPDARDAIKQAMVGQTFTDKGFMSTSKSWEKAEEFASGNRYNPHGVEAIVHINVPKGTKVLDLGSDGFISGSGEEETILNRGSSYKITAVTMNHRIGGLDIYADLITDTAKSASTAKTFDEILKFNPYHGADGRFSSANGAASFTYSPGKSKAHDNAIQREKDRVKGGSDAMQSYIAGLNPDVEYPERVEHWKKQIEAGNERPILVSSTDENRIIDGNHTLAAYKELGKTPKVYAMDRVEFLLGASEAKDTVEFIRQAIKDGKATEVKKS